MSELNHFDELIDDDLVEKTDVDFLNDGTFDLRVSPPVDPNKIERETIDGLISDIGVISQSGINYLIDKLIERKENYEKTGE